MTVSHPSLDLAEQLLISTRGLIVHLRPPLTAPGRPKVALFLTIAEQFEAALHLSRIGLVTHGAVHVRSMLEALVAMSLLENEQGYVDQMRYEKLKSEKKVYANVLKNQNLSGDVRDDLTKRLAACVQEHQALHQKGLRPRKISEDFGRAGYPDLLAPYVMLCGYSHNDLAVIALRHQGDQSMTYRATVPDEVLLSIVSVAMTALVAAAGQLSSIAKFPKGTFEQHYFSMDQILGNLVAGGGRAIGSTGEPGQAQ